MAELIHTCYRVLDLDRSVDFYENLGFEEVGRISIRDEATNVFMGMPGDGAPPQAHAQPRPHRALRDRHRRVRAYRDHG